MVNDLMVCRLDYQTWIKLPISMDIVWHRLSYSSMANDELNWTSMRLIGGSLGLFNGTIFLSAESCAVNRGFFYNAVRFARLLKCSTTEWSSFSWNSGGGYAFGRSTVLSVLCGSNFDTSQDSQIYLYMEWVLGVLGSSYLAAGAQWNLVKSVDEPLDLIHRSVRDVPWNPWDCLGCIFDFGILNQFWFCKFIQRTPEDGAIFTETSF
jgi:hypothetical protein